MKNIEALEEAIATNFKNKDLLRQAMVHRSYLNEHVHFALDHNERLEFLGDAVLEVVVTEYLYFKKESAYRRTIKYLSRAPGLLPQF